MKYKFLFNYKGVNYEEDVLGEHVREMEIGHDVKINEFFPKEMEDKTFYRVKMIVFGKGVKEIHLSYQYGTSAKVNNA